jgi:hypothetical protein
VAGFVGCAGVAPDVALSVSRTKPALPFRASSPFNRSLLRTPNQSRRPAGGSPCRGRVGLWREPATAKATPRQPVARPPA